jgi:hypothetical protein
LCLLRFPPADTCTSSSRVSRRSVGPFQTNGWEVGKAGAARRMLAACTFSNPPKRSWLVSTAVRTTKQRCQWRCRKALKEVGPVGCRHRQQHPRSRCSPSCASPSGPGQRTRTLCRRSEVRGSSFLSNPLYQVLFIKSSCSSPRCQVLLIKSSFQHDGVELRTQIASQAQCKSMAVERG